jgi:hypothetical protein
MLSFTPLWHFGKQNTSRFHSAIAGGTQDLGLNDVLLFSNGLTMNVIYDKSDYLIILSALE